MKKTYIVWVDNDEEYEDHRETIYAVVKTKKAALELRDRYNETSDGRGSEADEPDEWYQRYFAFVEILTLDENGVVTKTERITTVIGG